MSEGLARRSVGAARPSGGSSVDAVQLVVQRWLEEAVQVHSSIGVPLAVAPLVTSRHGPTPNASPKVRCDGSLLRSRPLLPEQWERFLAGAHGTPEDGDVVAAYARLTGYPDVAVREKATADST